MTTYTLTLTQEQMDTINDACAQAEQMWRYRSHHPELFTHADADTPLYEERVCRDEMKRYRTLSKSLYSCVD